MLIKPTVLTNLVIKNFRVWTNSLLSRLVLLKKGRRHDSRFKHALTKDKAMLGRLLGLVIVAVVVKWKWEPIKRLVSKIFDVDTFYETQTTPVDPITDAEPPVWNDYTPEITVYVTAKGTRYHKAGCQSLTDDAQAISINEAKKQHKPCGRCQPEG